MKILWLSWKDKHHPASGGAEIVAHALLSRLAADGHEVTLLTARYPGAAERDIMSGYRVIRVGGRLSVYWQVYRYYRTHMQRTHDLVVEEINTIPFFSRWYVSGPGVKRVLFVHQLAREVWWYEMIFPLSLVGYVIEPLYLWLLSGERVITVSESTRRDLMRYGFKADRIAIISEGIEMAPVEDLATVSNLKRSAVPTLLALGSLRPMKRTLDIIRAFEILKTQLPTAELMVAGDAAGRYGACVARAVARSEYCADIHMLGKVTLEEKKRLLRLAHVLVACSIKEGWGLIVTEANSQGTPAVVYDVDGLRDSVRTGASTLNTDKDASVRTSGKSDTAATGAVAAHPTPAALAEAVQATLASPEHYARLRTNAWTWSKTLTFDQQYKDFLHVLKTL